MSILHVRKCFNTLRPRQNGCHFPDDILKCIFLMKMYKFKISLKFVPHGPINNIPALDQIMAWRRQGDKPLSEPMMVWLPTYICVARPQWVKDGVVSNLTWSSIHLWRHYFVKASWAIHRGMWDFLDHQAPSPFFQILYCINNLQSQEDGAIMTE